MLEFVILLVDKNVKKKKSNLQSALMIISLLTIIIEIEVRIYQT